MSSKYDSMYEDVFYVESIMRFMLGGYRYEINRGEPPEDTYVLFSGSYQDCKDYIASIQNQGT
jgi:hypothetical protein